MNISVRQIRTIIYDNGLRKVIYNVPYKYETDLHKHTIHNMVYCDTDKNERVNRYNICIEYYIK